MSMSRNIVRDMLSSNGTVTINGSTAVVVNPLVPLSATSMIILTSLTPTGTVTQAAYISARTNGQVGTASFSVKSNVSDTSVYSYTIIG